MVKLKSNHHKKSTSRSELQEWIIKHKGTKTIQRVLISNNGLAAVKEMMSVRKWAYKTFGDSDAIQFVALVSTQDMEANAEFVRMADECVSVPGGPNNFNYANVDLIVQVAVRTKVDAVWPGWGHASENARLPKMLAKEGIYWIGPGPDAMQALGDKISSMIVAQTVGVPCLSWSGSGVTLSATQNSCNGSASTITIPSNVYRQGCIDNAQDGLEAAKKVGYPLMIKASEGGGGKGIRSVYDPSKFNEAFDSVQREVPGSPIFLMTLCGEARHLEVQLLADEHGEAISIYGRDCTVQRRHQKIFEEAPVTIVKSSEKWKSLEQGAVRLAKMVGYANAGTVEYLWDVDGERASFLELNPRLQVEHPCTEMISGVNLPACQLQIAMGIPLHCIADIRALYGQDQSNYLDPIDFENTLQMPPRGHVIASRITAEDPKSGFKPGGGLLTQLSFRPTPECWGYFSIAGGGAVHEFADSQFGHLFAWSSDGGSQEKRGQAIDNLVVALKQLSIQGSFPTTVEYLVRLLESKDFKASKHTTAWLDKIIAASEEECDNSKNHFSSFSSSSISVSCERAIIGGAVWKTVQQIINRRREAISSLTKGQKPSHASLSTKHSHSFIYSSYKCSVSVDEISDNRLMISLNGTQCFVEYKQLLDGGILCLFGGGQSMLIYAQGAAAVVSHKGKEANRDNVDAENDKIQSDLSLSIDGCTITLHQPSDPTKVKSQSAGKLVRFLVKDGEHVEAGQKIAEMEVMKMYLGINVRIAGKIRLVRGEGAVIAGELVARIENEDGFVVDNNFTPFMDGFECCEEASLIGSHLSDQWERYHGLVNDILLNGYISSADEDYHKMIISQYIECMFDYKLSNSILDRHLSNVSGKIPAPLMHGLKNCLCSNDEIDDDHSRIFVNTRKLKEAHRLLSTFARNECDVRDVPAIITVTDVLRDHLDGPNSFAIKTLSSLFTRILEDATIFDVARTGDEAMTRISVLSSGDLEECLRVYRSNCVSSQRFLFAGTLLKNLVPFLNHHNYSQENVDIKITPLGSFVSLMKRMSLLESKPFKSLVLAARQTLVSLQQPSLEQLCIAMEHKLLNLVHYNRKNHNSPVTTHTEKIMKLVDGCSQHSDVLPMFFVHDDGRMAVLALEIYIRRVFEAFEFVETKGWIDERIFTWIVNAPATTAAQNIGVNDSEEDAANSDDNKTLNVASVEQRSGAFAAFASVKECLDGFSGILDKFADFGTKKNLLYIAIPDPCEHHHPRTLHNHNDDGDNSHFDWSLFLQKHSTSLHSHSIQRVTIVLVRSLTTSTGFHTFRAKDGWAEDVPIRHCEPAMSYLLELPRIFSGGWEGLKLLFADPSGQVHIYKASHRENGQLSSNSHSRLFIRVLIRPMQVMRGRNTLSSLEQDAQEIFSQVLAAVSAVQCKQVKPFRCNHLYIYLLPTFKAGVRECARIFSGLMENNQCVLGRLGIGEGEIRANFREEREGTTNHTLVNRYRIFLFNKSGVINTVKIYQEVRPDPSQPAILQPIADWADDDKPYSDGSELDKKKLLASAPHPPPFQIDINRSIAHSLETSYCYDFPLIFEYVVKQIWAQFEGAMDGDGARFTCKELILDPNSDLSNPYALSYTNRACGQNDIGMVAWQMTWRTPHHNTRQQSEPITITIIVICNDICTQIGSFGLQEDRLFKAASLLARNRGWPRIFLSANSGARIGVCEGLKDVIKAKWINHESPEHGFEYLYLESEDYENFKKDVCAEWVATAKGLDEDEINDLKCPQNKGHWKITDILGGIGVETLSGSALIASETSAAYKEIFTCTFVTGRSVGIGAYLVRLGQRVIQKSGQPIILTGINALNKLLGKTVYESNLQIGGPQIMGINGVSHLIVESDGDGVKEIIKWLHMIPLDHLGVDGHHRIDESIRCARGSEGLGAFDGGILNYRCQDSIEREIQWTPPDDTSYNSRLLVTGTTIGTANDDGDDEDDNRNGVHPTELLGLLDKDTFVEVQGEWAKSVIVGRGRIGGMPVACILVETRTTATSLPADPATPTSQQRTRTQAGQVWYPDSAHKTAQFISDCNWGEGLPLVILANWRGFSGGQQDLLDEVLKFGALIVDALREYQWPVIVYLPPWAQLRGGSWVVLDGAINEDRIEIYADERARGGILEAEGLVSIKFREAQRDQMASRLLPKPQNSKVDGVDNINSSNSKQLMHKIACSFADLHDTPGRMLQMGIIKGIIEWKKARKFIYHRLFYLLVIERIVDRAVYLIGAVDCGAGRNGKVFKDAKAFVINELLPSFGSLPSAHEQYSSHACNQQLSALIGNNSKVIEEALQQWACSYRATHHKHA